MIEYDLIKLRLIKDFYNASHRYKIMKQPQMENISLNSSIDFIQQQELIQKYSHDLSQHREQIFAYIFMLKKTKKCSYWGREHEIKKGNMPSIWKDLYKLLQIEPLSSSVQIKKNNVEKVANETNMEVFSVKKQKQECRKNWTEEKEDYTKG